MLSGLCRRYRHDTKHRQEIDGIKCAFLTYEELRSYYAENGFNVIETKKPTAMDRHVTSWEYIGRAQKTTIDGVSGILIQLSATA